MAGAQGEEGCVEAPQGAEDEEGGRVGGGAVDGCGHVRDGDVVGGAGWDGDLVVAGACGRGQGGWGVGRGKVGEGKWARDGVMVCGVWPLSGGVCLLGGSLTFGVVFMLTYRYGICT